MSSKVQYHCLAHEALGQSLAPKHRSNKYDQSWSLLMDFLPRSTKKTWKLQQQPGWLISKGTLAFLFLNSKNKPLVFHNSCQGNSDFSRKRNKGIFSNLNKKVRLMPNQKKFKFETQNHVFRFFFRWREGRMDMAKIHYILELFFFQMPLGQQLSE